MKFYFMSSQPCALTIGGVYFGKTDGFARHADVCAQDEVFVEFRPQNALPICFFITEQLRFSPPERCEVYLMPDGIAIYAKDFTPCDFSLHMLIQERDGEEMLTCFQQGDRQVCLERGKEMFVNTLPPSFCPIGAKKAGDFWLVVSKDAFCLVDFRAQIRLYERCESVDVDGDILRARLTLLDSKGRKADCEWRLFGDNFQRISFTLLQEKCFPPDELLAFAFFESVLIGADFSPFLSDALLDKRESIASFLGEFCHVLPQDDPYACGLVYPKSERLFEVKIFRVEIEKGKIKDIHG